MKKSHEQLRTFLGGVVPPLPIHGVPIKLSDLGLIGVATGPELQNRRVIMSEPLSYVRFERGDPFPWKAINEQSGLRFGFHTFGGRYLVFCFYRSANDPEAQAALQAVQRHRSFFDNERASFFGISLDPSDKEEGRVQDSTPGIYFFHDPDGFMGRVCGTLPANVEGLTGAASLQPTWLIVDPTLRLIARIPLTAGFEASETVFQSLASLPPPKAYAGFELPIPVLVIPNVFEEQLCRHLVRAYDHHGGTESGIHRAGSSVHDHSFKRRKDYTIEDQQLIRILQGRISARVLPEIERLFFMKITRMERYIIGCYAAEDNAHFRPHRDNGPGLTAHRRYAVSINLSNDFDGGEVSFPEYSPRGIKAPRGWAVVFPANILHAVSQVTYGRRYAFLPFVYDEAGKEIRERELARYHGQASQDGDVAA